jgi:hypothetical protein
MLCTEMFAEMTTLFIEPLFIQPQRAGGVVS